MVRNCTAEEYERANTTSTPYLLTTFLSPGLGFFFTTILALYTSYHFFVVAPRRRPQKSTRLSFLEKLCLTLQYFGVINCLGVFLSCLPLQTRSASLNTTESQLLIDNMATKLLFIRETKICLFE